MKKVLIVSFILISLSAGGYYFYKKRKDEEDLANGLKNNNDIKSGTPNQTTPTAAAHRITETALVTSGKTVAEAKQIVALNNDRA